MGVIPDYLFRRATDIEPAFLRERGVEALILDIDNTLAFDNHPDVPPEIDAWLRGMERAGLRLAIVSNNRESRVKAFAAACGNLAYVADARKPSRAGFARSAETLGTTAEKIAVVGDQLFTDIAFGNRFGCTTILVERMGPDVPLFVRMKRVLEAPLMPYIKKRKRVK